MGELAWQRSLRVSEPSKGKGPFVSGKASAKGDLDSISHHRASIAFRTKQAPLQSPKRGGELSTMLHGGSHGGLASGAGGDPPKRPNGFDKSNTGHYAPDVGPFVPLHPSMAFQMADPRGVRRQGAPLFPGGQRPRANSMPALGQDGAFYSTFRSVMTHGLLPQNEMRQKGIGFNPSHDGRQRDANQIEVTRLSGGLSPRRQGALSQQAVNNPYHGALTVVLERGQEMQTRQPTRQDLSFDQRMRLLSAPNEVGPALENYMLASHGQVLTPQGQQQAEQRMHSSFLVMANASQPSNSNRAHEQQRPRLTPQQMNQVVVPEQHMSAARQVIRDLNVRGGLAFPQLQSIHSSDDMAPQYNTRHGNAVNVSGIQAPAYHTAIASHANRHGDTDIHIVKTGMSQQAQAPQTRPRSRTF